jgi:hypothetical protein
MVRVLGGAHKSLCRIGAPGAPNPGLLLPCSPGTLWCVLCRPDSSRLARSRSPIRYAACVDEAVLSLLLTQFPVAYRLSRSDGLANLSPEATE